MSQEMILQGRVIIDGERTEHKLLQSDRYSRRVMEEHF